MAKRSKLRLPLTVALKKVEEGSEEASKRAEKKRIAASTLQSTNVNFDGWNKQTLLGRFSTGTGRGLGVAYVQTEIIDGAIAIPISSNEHIPLGMVADELKDRQNCVALFVELPCSLSEVTEQIKQLDGTSGFVFLEPELSAFGFALATEATNFRTLQTVDGSEGTLGTLYSFAENALRSLGSVLGDISNRYCIVSPNGENAGQTLWSEGMVYAIDVDIEKVRNSARKEQINDTIKRLLDAARHPRYAHQPTEERLISTQGVLWLTQIVNLIEISDWITSTTLFSEVFPEFAPTIPAPRYLRKKQPDLDCLVGFLDGFVEIPAGEFSFGRDQSRIPSEPPADPIVARLEKFWISRCLVTEHNWFSLFKGEIQHGASRPKSDVNLFDAQDFCLAMMEACGSEISKRFGHVRARLPSEYQWEAAAGGYKALDYPWGSEYVPSNCNADMRIGQTTDVREYEGAGESPFGLLDMSGNLREWTRSYAGTQGSDWQLHSAERVSGPQEPLGPMSRMVIRGGSYSYDPECIQTWVRNTWIASTPDNQTGFRVVLEHE